MLYLADNQMSSYQELWGEAVGAAVVKGQAVIIKDVFCFYHNGDELGKVVVPIWEARQVLAEKSIGTGEDIERGEQVYYVVATGLVTAHPTGTIGTEYYFIGICKKAALAADTEVLISFWGDEYNFADRSA